MKALLFGMTKGFVGSNLDSDLERCVELSRSPLVHQTVGNPASLV